VLTPEERAQLDSEDIWSKLAQQLVDSFTEAMDDDFNSPRAVAALFSFLSDAYRQGVETSGGERELTAAMEIWQEMTAVLGLRPGCGGLTRTGQKTDTLAEHLVEAMLVRREKARKTHDFATADLLRDLLEVSGVQLEDTPTGPRWKMMNPSKGKEDD